MMFVKSSFEFLKIIRLKQLALFIGLAGILMSGLSGLALNHSNQSKIVDNASIKMTHIADILNGQLVVYGQGLLEAGGTFFSSQRLTPLAKPIEQDVGTNEVSAAVVNLNDAFKSPDGIFKYGLLGSYSTQSSAGQNKRLQSDEPNKDLASEFPSLRGFGYIQRVRADKLGQFFANQHRNGKTKFSLRKFNPKTEEYYVIEFTQPELSYQQSIDPDIVSDTILKNAMDVATKTGKPVMTAPIHLVSYGGQVDTQLLLLSPVYESGMTLASEDQRLAAIRAWTYVPIFVNEMMLGMHLNDKDFEFELSDVSEGAKPHVFWHTPRYKSNTLGGFERQIPLSIFGRNWLLRIQITPLFATHYEQVSPVFLTIFLALLSILSAAIFYVVACFWRRRNSISQCKATE